MAQDKTVLYAGIGLAGLWIAYNIMRPFQILEEKTKEADKVVKDIIDAPIKKLNEGDKIDPNGAPHWWNELIGNPEGKPAVTITIDPTPYPQRPATPSEMGVKPAPLQDIIPVQPGSFQTEIDRQNKILQTTRSISTTPMSQQEADFYYWSNVQSVEDQRILFNRGYWDEWRDINLKQSGGNIVQDGVLQSIVQPFTVFPNTWKP